MAFPTSPTNGQTTTINNIIYTYNSTKGAWVRVTGASTYNITANSITLANTVSTTTLTVSGATTTGTIVASGAITPASNASVNIGGTNSWFATIYGKATQAQYADLAEHYSTDSDYKPGTVVVFGGSKEITISTVSHDSSVAGVISTDPAYLMNSMAEGLPVALTGRVPCLVKGPVSKGTVLVTSDEPGVAQAIDNAKFVPGCVIGKALESINTDSIETIEVVVGKH